MARGVDIPEVDWVIQFDPPSSAKYEQSICKAEHLSTIQTAGNEPFLLTEIFSGFFLQCLCTSLRKNGKNWESR